MPSKFNICQYCKNLFPTSVFRIHKKTCSERPVKNKKFSSRGVGSSLIKIHNQRATTKKEVDQLKYTMFLQKRYSTFQFDAFFETALKLVENERSWLSSHTNVTIVDEIIKDPGNEFVMTESHTIKTGNLRLIFYPTDPEINTHLRYFKIASLSLDKLNVKGTLKSIFNRQESNEDLLTTLDENIIDEFEKRVDYLMHKTEVVRFYQQFSVYQLPHDEFDHYILELYDRVQHRRLHIHILSKNVITQFDRLTIQFEDEVIEFPLNHPIKPIKIEPSIMMT
ncbi:MAG: hypothetical protein IH840_00585 [Candidatus Heimdallarchaeota archaeon]|nr:hypothetical protein [Candidatus Heimdallarchaeota archaeon]